MTIIKALYGPKYYSHFHSNMISAYLLSGGPFQLQVAHLSLRTRTDV